MSKRYRTPEQIERHRKESREHYQRNKERIMAARKTPEGRALNTERHRRYVAANRERMREYERAYRATPVEKEKIRLRNKKWREENVDTLKLAKAEYHRQNRERNNAKSREYQKNNRDRLNQQCTAYYRKNRAAVLAQMKEKYADPVYREEVKARRAEYRQLNRETINAKNREAGLAKRPIVQRPCAWCEALFECRGTHRKFCNLECAAQAANYRIAIRHRECEAKTETPITPREWRYLIEYFDNRCAYCNETCESLEMEHVQPISDGGTNDAINIVPACRFCNGSKSDKPLLVFLFPMHFRSFKRKCHRKQDID